MADKEAMLPYKFFIDKVCLWEKSFNRAYWLGCVNVLKSHFQDKQMFYTMQEKLRAYKK